MSFVAAATAIGFTGVGATIAAGAMMGGATTVAGNVIGGRDPFDNIGRGVVLGGITGGLTPGVSEMTGLSIPASAGIVQGGLTALATGDIGQGLMAGMGAYGAYGLAEGLGGGVSGSNVGAEQAFGDVQAVEGSVGDKFNKYLTGPDAGTKPFTDPRIGTGNFLKDNFKYITAAAAPILADQAVKSNLPTTVTQPGMIRPYSFDPYSGTYIAGNPYQATPTRAAGGGLMGMNDGGYNPGQLDFTQKSEPVVRMAEGGVPGYAGNAGSVVSAPLDTKNEIYQYFAKPETQALLKSGNDAAIAQVLQDKDWKLADVAKATGTQNQLTDYERRFTQAVNTPTTDATEFLAATTDVGLQNKNLAAALSGSGLSAAGQYASTHGLADTGGILDASGKPIGFYNTIGYTAGALPGDKGGLEGLYANINYSAKGLQDQINAGKITVAEAQRLADAEMRRVGVSGADVKSATGLDLANLFKDKVGDVVCGPGYKKSIDGKTCVPDTTVVTQETQCATGFHYDPVLKQCVKNLDATQTTSTNVTTPTSISTAASTALPVGVSGAGITTINPNGTITTRPDLTLGMGQVRDDYVRGGGSLGYTSPTFASLKAVEDKYPLRGGSKQSYDYLTGKADYDPVPYTKTGELMKPYASSVLGIPMASAKQMYLFDPATKTYKVNPNYVIPTYDKDGKKSLNLTNADVKTFVDKGPSADAFYTWATTNNLTPEQIAQASERPINEISKLFTGAKDLVGKDGKIDQTKLDEKTAADEKEYFDEAAYLKAYPDVAEELRTGKSASGKPVLFTSGYDHYLKYGKGSTTHLPKFKSGYTPPVTKAGGGLMNMAMARGGMSQQFDLGGYSDGGRLLRGPGDGVSDSIPATIGNKRPARLADGEFVVPARIVSELGNGSTEAGARKLYAMMDRVQAARRGTVGKGRVAKNSRSDKHLPA